MMETMTATLSESEFNTLVDETFDALETALDSCGADVDADSAGGVLTLEFENDTTMVFSRQPASRQLWLAARSGGFHFEYDAAAQDWRGTRDGQLLKPFVVQQMSEQAGIELDWS